MLRDAAISLSLANICFLKVWGKLLSGAGSYFSEFPVAYVSIIVDVLLLASVFLAAMTLVRRSGKTMLKRLARWSFLLAVAIALNSLVLLILTFSRVNFSTILGRNVAWFAAVGLTTAFVVTLIIVRDHIIRWAPPVLLALLPFVLVTFSHSALQLTRNVGVAHAAISQTRVLSITPKRPVTRVLWIIFDEMDQRMSFSERPEGVEMPELDRLRKQSVYAVNAYPPAPLTYMSMPALITGRLVEEVTPVRANELMIKFDGSQNAIGWSTQPNIFSETRGLGFNAGLAGWCHPYCEVIGNSLTRCEDAKEKDTGGLTLRASMFLQAQGLISSVPLVQQAAIPVVQRVNFVNRIVTTGEREKYTVRYKRVLESALKVALDPDLDLVFVHSPAPHPPGIYDRTTNDLSLDSKNGYIDNLELVDRTIGELRQAMESAGLWDKTTVVISADHWWRTEMWSRGPFWTREDEAASGGKMDHRIPFLIKLPGQQEQLTYTPGFNTVVTHDLILALMRGEVTSPGSIAVWLDQHRSITDSPYNRDELLP